MIITADVLDWAREYEGEPFHALLADPPYEINFMSRGWDNSGVAFRPETWAALGRHLLPGAFCMAFSGARTYHRMACAIEDAGFVLHSMIGWVYGSGFPKATRIDTQIDRAAGVEREVVGIRVTGDGHVQNRRNGRNEFGTFETKNDGYDMDTAPATPLASIWSGHRYGLQALKPALEPICVFQKPYVGKPVDSITKTGAGAINIEAARIGTSKNVPHSPKRVPPSKYTVSLPGNQGTSGWDRNVGRWPANLILDEAAARELDQMSGTLTSHGGGHASYGGSFGNGQPVTDSTAMERFRGDSGGASRFFFTAQADAIDEALPFYYTAKASRRERDAGLEGFEARDGDEILGDGLGNGPDRIVCRNHHPCVKALSLCRYLATLLLPPAEYAPRRILVPFAGSGSECIGAGQAGWEVVVGIEREQDYAEIAEARIAHWQGVGVALPLEAVCQPVV